MADSINNKYDIIDSREVIERIDELQTEKDDLEQQRDKAVDDDKETAETALADWIDDYDDELKALKALAEGAEGYSEDWHRGATLISDSYFKNYAREMAKDLHGVKIRDAEWPFTCIDWEQAATELQQDYTSVDFDGVDYWVR
jgi:hypothetical protein